MNIGATLRGEKYNTIQSNPGWYLISTHLNSLETKIHSLTCFKSSRSFGKGRDCGLQGVAETEPNRSRCLSRASLETAIDDYLLSTLLAEGKEEEEGMEEEG